MAPVQWFGRVWVDAFGGDQVFEGLPDGWARRTESGVWQVFGMQDPDDHGAYDPLAWSDRERAIIEHLGPEWFFNVETGELAQRLLVWPQVPPVPMYLADGDGVLRVVQPDGSSQLADLVAPEVDEHALALKQVAQRAELFIEEMTDAGMGDLVSLDSDESLEWVETWARGQSVYPRELAVMMVGSWLGEFALRHVPPAKWVSSTTGLEIQLNGERFDPFHAAGEVIDDNADSPLWEFVFALRSSFP